MSKNEPEAINALFEKSLEHVPPPLRRATLRTEFPPSYVLTLLIIEVGPWSTIKIVRMM